MPLTVEAGASEPSAGEGLPHVRIGRALHESTEVGTPIQIPPSRAASRPSSRSTWSRAGIRKPTVVKAQSASV